MTFFPFAASFTVCEVLACYFLQACLRVVIRRGYDLTLVKRLLTVVLSKDCTCPLMSDWSAKCY